MIVFRKEFLNVLISTFKNVFEKKNVSSILFLVFISNHHLSCLIFPLFLKILCDLKKKIPYNFHLLITSLLICIHLQFPSPPEFFAPRLVLLITISVEALGFLYISKKFPLDTWGKIFCYSFVY